MEHSNNFIARPLCRVVLWKGGYFLQLEGLNQILHTPRQICRDTNIFEFAKPQKNINNLKSHASLASTHFGRTQIECVKWKWPDDSRVFLVPTDMVPYLPNSSMFRDVIAYISHEYRKQKYPVDCQIITTYRSIADGIGLSWHGGLAVEISNLLTFARVFTVDKMRIITELAKDGTVQNSIKSTFGFISSWDTEDIVNGKKIPENKAKILITVTRTYADMIEKLIPAPVPVDALIQARKAPRRLIPATKNMVYRLAARVPQRKVTYNIDTLRSAMGISPKTRPDKVLKTIDRVLEVLYPIMVYDFILTKDKATIILAGKLVGGKTDN